jgi:ABC-type Fe3+-siderophore transport system permease subunit
MKYLALYILVGAIFAVWTAINAQRLDRDEAADPGANLVSMLAAYVLVALVWPVSVALFVYALVAGVSNREGPAPHR